jgi:hypothetical protein
MTPLVKMHTLGHDFRRRRSTPAACATTAWRRWSASSSTRGSSRRARVHQRATLRGRRPVRPDRGHPARARVEPRHPRGHRRGAAAPARRASAGDPVQPLRPRPLRPGRLRAHLAGRLEDYAYSPLRRGEESRAACRPERGSSLTEAGPPSRPRRPSADAPAPMGSWREELRRRAGARPAARARARRP